DATSAIADKAGQPIPIQVQRNGQAVTVTITPVLEPEPSPVVDKEGFPTGEMKRQAKMMAKWDYEHVSVGAGEAFVDAMRTPVIVVAGLAGMVTKPAQLKDNVGGPISIAQQTSEATKRGIDWIIGLAAMLSISVGIFNLLPIPTLDGGQMLVAVAEMLRGGKRLSIKVQGALTAAGLAMVLVLFVSVMLIDVGRLTKNDKSGNKSAPSTTQK
ncbi:MAG TPA: M50 family metallopeptidase, partial [Fimbriimonadaceae bacterium]|nr:M50 family metallopeptidase [Fimbriimonadaceae bacterium]